jgi:carbonic anhydrase/acetyltransferase-like protein (isoleucine patch superfamily)
MLKRALYEVGRALRETGQAIDRIGLRALEKPIYKEPFSRHRTVMNLYEKCVCRAVGALGRRCGRRCLPSSGNPLRLPPSSDTRRHPWLDTSVFVAPNATVVGQVDINQHSSVWYGAVVRGDLNAVDIGGYTAIQDRAVVHTTKSVEGHVAAATTIGNYVVVGPAAVLHSCVVEVRALASSRKQVGPQERERERERGRGRVADWRRPAHGPPPTPSPSLPMSQDYVSIGAGSVVMEGALVEEHAVLAEGSVVHPGRRIPAGQLWGGNPAVYIRDLTKAELAGAEGAATDLSELAKEHAYEFLPQNTAYAAAEKLGVEDGAVKAINAQQAEYEAAVRGGKPAAASA